MNADQLFEQIDLLQLLQDFLNQITITAGLDHIDKPPKHVHTITEFDFLSLTWSMEQHQIVCVDVRMLFLLWETSSVAAIQDTDNEESV